jgi:hypothetical protein
MSVNKPPVAGASLVKSFDDWMAPAPKNPVRVRFSIQEPDEIKAAAEPTTLAKSLLDLLNGPKESVERLAFETDPNLVNQYQAVYRAKVKLLPDSLLKRIIIQDDLVAAIIRARETQMASFGRPRPSRFDTGYVIEPNVGVKERLTPEERKEMDTRIQKAVQTIWTCGHTEGVDKKDHISFAQFIQMTTRNAVGLGRIGVEIVYKSPMADGEKQFHYFRPTDVGTIFKASPQRTHAQAIRAQAVKMLKDLVHGSSSESAPKSNIDESKFEKGDYAWIQVIDGRPVQAFTDDEMRVHSFYSVVDVELDGYPVTPIDTMISAVTTHINITTHNKLYFATGRASHGMLVFKSDDVDQSTLHQVKQQFNASINSVNNSWRMPVFSVGTKDDIEWQSIDSSSRDAEFQYLTDMNARVILSAFQMSPDELPGWAYLSRGTNNQSLSESNNEYRMEAARDQGVRPLIAQFEDFLNGVIFPLIDPALAKLCSLRFKGLDADTEEKESTRLQQDMPVHMTYDEVMTKVEKPPIGRAWGGEFPLNPQLQAIQDKFLTVNDVRQHFFGLPPDPRFDYVRDPFWFQNIQVAQAQQQADAQAQQAQQPGGGQDGGGDAGGGSPPDGATAGGGDKSPPGGDPQAGAQDAAGGQSAPEAGGATALQQGQQPPPGQDLSRSIDQAMHILTKSEEDLPPSVRKLHAQHRVMIDRLRDGLKADLGDAAKEILEEAARIRKN